MLPVCLACKNKISLFLAEKKRLPYHRTEFMHAKLPPQIKIKVLYELLLDHCYPIHIVIVENVKLKE